MGETNRQSAAARGRALLSGRGRGGAAVPLALLALGVAAGQAPLSWAWLAVPCWAGALALLTASPDWRVAARRGLWFGTVHFAAAWVWIVDPFLVDPVRHGWMAPFALVGLSGGMALYWGAAFGLAALLGQGNRRRQAVLAVVAMTAAEMIRGVAFTGFPWATVGHIWIGWPQMQIAAWGGTPALTLLTLAAAALPVLAGPPRLALGLIGGAALASAPAAVGLMRVPEGPARATPYMVRVVQPDAEQHLKWHPDYWHIFYQRLLDYTAAPAPDGGPRPDLVVWPEIALPFPYHDAGAALAQVAEAADGAQVALGLQRRDPGDRYYNMMLRLDGEGQVAATYDKHHLVPFGEFMPFADQFARMGIFGLAANAAGGFTSGVGPELMAFGPLGQGLPLICYEAIFPRDLLRAPDRADFLLHLTNDAWFGTWSGPYQHLAQARLRAVEFGLPVMRAANTGISGGIDPYGRLMATLPLGEPGFADLTLPKPLPPTVYSRAGDGPMLGLLLVLAGLGAAVFRRRHIDAPGETA